MRGLEPPASGATDRRSNQLSYIHRAAAMILRRECCALRPARVPSDAGGMPHGLDLHEFRDAPRCARVIAEPISRCGLRVRVDSLDILGGESLNARAQRLIRAPDRDRVDVHMARELLR